MKTYAMSGITDFNQLDKFSPQIRKNTDLEIVFPLKLGKAMKKLPSKTKKH